MKRPETRDFPPSLAIVPVTQPLDAIVRVPGSKSLTNRTLLIAALAEGETTLENALFSDDSHYLAESLRQLGFEVISDEANARIRVQGLGGHIPARQAALYIGNAGTAARFLTAMLTLGHGEFIVDGDARMRQRPIGDLVSALTQLGAVITPQGEPLTEQEALCPPIRIVASGLSGGHTRVAGNTSSQYLSGLLMAAPYAQKAVEIEVTQGLNSKPYVEMTLQVMADFGVSVERQGYERFVIQAGRYHSPGVYTIESDASAASYFFAAPAICGGRVRVVGLGRHSTQGDIRFLEVLTHMGCTVLEGEAFLEVHGPSRLRGVAVDLSDIPDIAQTLAAIAPFAESPTTIRGIASARLKETDRIAAMVTELTRLGVNVEEHADGLTIQPCHTFRPAAIQTYNDHRMAMAFALVGLRLPGITIQNPGCVSKTFPNYFEVLAELQRVF